MVLLEHHGYTRATNTLELSSTTRDDRGVTILSAETFTPSLQSKCHPLTPEVSA